MASIKKFGFIDLVNRNKFYYKYYQDNDSKHKFYLCKSWLLYNCTKVMDTLAQNRDINGVFFSTKKCALYFKKMEFCVCF